MDRTYTYLNGIIGMAVCVVLLTAKVGCTADENLVLNGGFEIGASNVPASWTLTDAVQGNLFDWITDERHSGNRSLRMNSVNPAPPGHSMGITSNSFEVPAYSRVDVSVWLKATDVVNGSDVSWYGLRVTLTAYDESGGKIEHRDLMNTRGSFSWKKIRGGMTAPERTRTMDLSIKLTTVTGVVWVDDARVHVAQELPEVDIPAIEAPVLIPHPWQLKLTMDTFELNDVAVIAGPLNPTVRQEIESFFASRSVDCEFLEADDTDILHYSTHLFIGDGADPVFNQEFSERFPEYDWTDLGDQGYFLAADKGNGPNYIYLGANTDVGIFYAIQTLKQLEFDEHIYLADILDRPTLSRRGIPMGLQWFEERKGEALKRLTELKFNLVWVQGSFLDDYLDIDNWRLDFTPAHEAILEEFIELYQENFIDVWIAIGPRGKNPPLQHSSDADINTLVRKMDVLYGLGLRRFGLRFDDLQNVGEDRLLTAEDINFFDDDIGAAQVYFISEVFGRLKAMHPDIESMVIPMDYNQSGNFGDMTQAGIRLQQFYGLPPDIGIYSVACYSEDVLAMIHLTGHDKMMIGSNFYVEGNGNLPEYVIPFLDFIDWGNPMIRCNIAGFTWLPKIHHGEDEALVSWHTMADFAWAPERYDPVESFERAVTRYLADR